MFAAQALFPIASFHWQHDITRQLKAHVIIARVLRPYVAVERFRNSFLPALVFM